MADCATESLFQFKGANLSRLGGGPILRDLEWTVRENETWALVGASGSGKTTLAETLFGRHRLVSGSLI